VKTFGLTLVLQDDPAKIESYKEYHRAVWPEVKARLQECGVQGMQIFLRGTRMFMYLTTDDTFEPARDFARINEDPVSARWNELMATLQARAPEANLDEWWAPMELVFDLEWPTGKSPG
jgi:L-rhamnose mutarotase